jgi:hypothetical protein
MKQLFIQGHPSRTNSSNILIMTLIRTFVILSQNFVVPFLKEKWSLSRGGSQMKLSDGILKRWEMFWEG